MNNWLKFGIVWGILMIFRVPFGLMGMVIGAVCFAVLDFLFGSKDDSSHENVESSGNKPKSVSIIENGKEKKVCPECNAKVSPDANWCPQCGHQFKK